MAETYFNLLAPVKKPKTYWDKIYDWILGYAKIVLIFVELLIIMAYFGRVFVENQKEELVKKYDQEVLLIKNLEDNFEPEFRVITRKNTEYLRLWENSNNYTDVLREVFNYIPSPKDEFSLRIGGGVIVIFGYDDLSALRILEESLKSSETFGNTATVDALTIENGQFESNSGEYALRATIEDEFLKRGAVDK